MPNKSFQLTVKKLRFLPSAEFVRYPFGGNMTRSSNRSHDRTGFFKYMSAGTARIVLTNRTLRWSSPLLFNDPFDVPRELLFGVTTAEITKALMCRVAALIESPPEDTSDMSPKVRLIVETVKRGITPELKAKLLAGLEESASTHKPTGSSLEDLRELWRSWVPDLRILCLAESPAHVAMWFHYAEQYKGAVIELRCIDELDSAWLVAQPVVYPETKPEVYTAEGWAELLTMRNEIAVRRILQVSTHTKSPDWSYEKEWRIMTFKRPTDRGHYTDYKIDPRELGGVYLGPLMSPADRTDLLSLVSDYPNAGVFEVSLGMSRELVFNQIRG